MIRPSPRFIQGSDALIVGLATSYRFEALAPFLHSLAETAYRGSVVLYVGGQTRGCLQKLHDLGVETREAAPFLSPDTDPQFARYAMYLDCLSKWPNALNFVMLSDIRDVVFQSNPAAQSAILDARRPCLHTWLEHDGLDLLREPTNRDWISLAYGPTELRRLAGQPISCSGISMGNHAGALAYIAAMLEEARNQRLTLRYKGVDQGIHNYLIWNRRAPWSVVRRNGEHVLTLGIDRSETHVVQDDTVYLKDGTVPAVLHQWDRHPKLTELVARRFAKPPAEPKGTAASETLKPPLLLAWIAENTPQEHIKRLVASAAEATCGSQLCLLGPGVAAGASLFGLSDQELLIKPGGVGFHTDIASVLAAESGDRLVLALNGGEALLLDDPFRTRLSDSVVVTMVGAGNRLKQMIWRDQIAALTDADTAARIGWKVPVSPKFLLGRAKALTALLARIEALRTAYPSAHEFVVFQVAALGGSHEAVEILPNFSLVANLEGFNDSVVSLTAGLRFPERSCAVVLKPDRSRRMELWIQDLIRRFDHPGS